MNIEKIKCNGLLIRDNCVLLIKEKKIAKWHLPGGNVEDDELLEDCLVREFQEETSLVVKPLRIYAVLQEPKKIYLIYLVELVDGQLQPLQGHIDEAVWIPLHKISAIDSALFRLEGMKKLLLNIPHPLDGHN